MKFSKNKCNVFHLNWGKSQYQYRLRDGLRAGFEDPGE